MKKLVTMLIVASLAGLGLTSCRPKKIEIAPEIAASDEALFKAGQDAVKKDTEKARLYFRQVIESFPKSFYAQRAKLAIADSYFAKGDEGSMILAASEYREFIQLYPFSPSAPYAQYQIAMSYFKKALKPGRDQTKTQQALVEFRKVLANFPTSEEASHRHPDELSFVFENGRGLFLSRRFVLQVEEGSGQRPVFHQARHRLSQEQVGAESPAKTGAHQQDREESCGIGRDT
jgi:tetratricopeptide (TPR) repeat protein